MTMVNSLLKIVGAFAMVVNSESPEILSVEVVVVGVDSSVKFSTSGDSA